MTSCADIIANSNAQFGTSGVRGLVEDLNDATCFAYTYAFIQHLKNSQRLQQGAPVWVGMDMRPSSAAMARACLAAIEHAGCSPVFCGVLPTPALAHSALGDRAPAVMITGSHIPFDRNGIKFYRASGEMLKQDEAPVINCADDFPVDLFASLALLDEAELPAVDPIAEDNWRARYKQAFDGLLDGMVIGHYQHSAAGRDLFSQILESLGARVVPLGRSEVFVPIDTEAVSAADTDQARTWSAEHGLDALISTDGDGDRPLLADETGTYFRGDTLGILAAKALQSSHVVTPVSSNGALEKTGWFATILRTRIGSPHVIAAMQEVDKPDNRVVGFEANGGFLSHSRLSSPWNGVVLSALPTRDSVLPVLCVIALARQMKMALSQLHQILPCRITASDRLVDTAREKSTALIESLGSDPVRCAVLNCDGAALVSKDETDGLRMTFDNEDVVHIRPSGNAPELRVYVESSSNERATELLKHARDTVAAML
ncbi:MAG: phosphomannomutase [Rhizobiaceae bacterium]|nr:phosphomannomutase [Rhizobiaceae bacterium]